MVTITDIQNDNNNSVIFTFENPTREELKIINDLKKKFIDKQAEEDYWTIGKKSEKNDKKVEEQQMTIQDIEFLPVGELDEIPFLTDDMKQELIAKREEYEKSKENKEKVNKPDNKKEIVW